MRNVMKATTLESRFPLLAVEHGCIISKDADITAAFEVELPGSWRRGVVNKACLRRLQSPATRISRVSAGASAW